MADEKTSAYDRLCQQLARCLGARRAWVVSLAVADMVAQVGLEEASLVQSLSSCLPLSCEDIRELGKACRREGRALVVDNTLATFVGCAAVQLGAHVSVEALSDGMSLVGVSKDVERPLPGLVEALDGLPALSEEACERLLESLPLRERTWHEASDAAQVVASYLRCHPSVQEVRYPGLKTDPSFSVAARTLRGGFGPMVDYLVDGCWRRTVCVAGDAREQVLSLEASLLAQA